MWFFCAGDEYASRFLIENGADVSVVLPDTVQTPLHLAALYNVPLGDDEIANSISRVAQLLLQHGASANAQDSSLRLVY
jgi:ankyrin repeat protein